MEWTGDSIATVTVGIAILAFLWNLHRDMGNLHRDIGGPARAHGASRGPVRGLYRPPSRELRAPQAPRGPGVRGIHGAPATRGC